MGIVPTKPSINDELAPFIPYICGKVARQLTVNPDVVLEIKNSTLKSGFIKGKHKGVFTKTFLPKTTVICRVSALATANPIDVLFNDGMVDLEPLIIAETSQETYKAWKNMRRLYYDLEKAKNIINIRMVADGANNIYYESIKEIPAGSELIRFYGFTTWILETFELLTNRNVAGFAKFIHELNGTIAGDPYEFRAKKLNTVLSRFVPNVENIDLARYDDDNTRTPLKYIGNEVQLLYMA